MRDGNFDDPRLTDYKLLNQNLADLKEGKTIEAPIYDFKTSTRVGYRTVVGPRRCCSPRHPTRFEPLYTQSNCVASNDVASNICRALASSSRCQTFVS